MRPDDWNVNYKDCRINLEDKEQKLSIITIFDEYNMWWSLEYHKITWLIYQFGIEMIKNEKVYNKDPAAEGAKVLTMDAPLVKKWLNSERIKWTKMDQKLFDNLYQQLNDV